MPTDAATFATRWPTTAALLRTDAPEIARAFGSMFQPLMKEGALAVKQKELIALAIGVAVHCEPCIHAHVEKALKSGATPEEMREAIGVAVMMGGGPAYTHAAMAMEAIRHYAGEAAPATA